MDSMAMETPLDLPLKKMLALHGATIIYCEALILFRNYAAS